MDHIVVFKNSLTQYDVMHYFAQSLSRALEKQGVKITLMDFSETNRLDFMRSLYAHPPDCTLGFNGPHQLENGCYLASEVEIPHIAWLVDSAHYFDDMVACPYHILIAPDQTSRDLLLSWGATHSHFLPHAFDAALTTPPQKKRIYPISFCGSLIDYIAIEETWQKKWPKEVFKALIDAAQRTLAESTLSYQEVFSNRVLPLIADATPLEKTNLATELDLYLRGVDRIELLKALEGLPVHLFGNAQGRPWDHFLDIKKGYTIHPSLPFPEILKVMADSQIVLNSSPMFKTGGHERIFYGLGLGAAVLTNQTPWLENNFALDQEVLSYVSTQWERAGSLLEGLLENPSAIEKIAFQGQARVLKEHTWDMRAQQLLPLAEKAIEVIGAI